MSHFNTVVGLDVHKDSIVAAALEAEARRFALTTKFANEPGEVRRFVEKLSRFAPLEFVYEAGPCGYQTHRQMAELGLRPRDAPDAAAGIVGEEQSAVGRDRDADRAAPDLAVRGDEAGDEVLIFTRSFSVRRVQANHFVARALGAVP